MKTGIKEESHLWFDLNGSGPVKTYYMNYSETSQTKWALVSTSKSYGNIVAKAFTKDGTAVNEQNYPDPLYRKDAEDAYDKNDDFVITEKEFAEGEQYLCGDLNRDGKVNAERTNLCLLAADWNEDKAINAEDARGLLSFLRGIPAQI